MASCLYLPFTAGVCSAISGRGQRLPLIIENEILYIHNVFETSCPLSDIERVEARKVLLYRRPLSGGAKYFIRLYRKNGRKTGMIIWGEGFKYYNYESAEEKLKEFFQLMESRGIPCRMTDGWDWFFHV